MKKYLLWFIVYAARLACAMAVVFWIICPILLMAANKLVEWGVNGEGLFVTIGLIGYLVADITFKFLNAIFPEHWLAKKVAALLYS